VGVVYLASLVLGHLVHGVLPAVLALAVGAASLRYVNLRRERWISPLLVFWCCFCLFKFPDVDYALSNSIDGCCSGINPETLVGPSDVNVAMNEPTQRVKTLGRAFCLPVCLPVLAATFDAEATQFVPPCQLFSTAQFPVVSFCPSPNRIVENLSLKPCHSFRPSFVAHTFSSKHPEA